MKEMEHAQLVALTVTPTPAHPNAIAQEWRRVDFSSVDGESTVYVVADWELVCVFIHAARRAGLSEARIRELSTYASLDQFAFDPLSAIDFTSCTRGQTLLLTPLGFTETEGSV